MEIASETLRQAAKAYRTLAEEGLQHREEQARQKRQSVIDMLLRCSSEDVRDLLVAASGCTVSIFAWKTKAANPRGWEDHRDSIYARERADGKTGTSIRMTKEGLKIRETHDCGEIWNSEDITAEDAAGILASLHDCNITKIEEEFWTGIQHIINIAPK